MHLSLQHTHCCKAQTHTCADYELLLLSCCRSSTGMYSHRSYHIPVPGCCQPLAATALLAPCRADSLPQAVGAAGAVCVSKLPGGKDPPQPTGTQRRASLQGEELQSGGDALDLHCWSYQGGTGLAEMPSWLLLSLPGPSASRAVAVVTREGNQAEPSPATREPCTNLTAN